MKQHYNDEDFLVRWLNNELTETERVDFENSEAYSDYKKIIEGSNKFKMPDYNKEKNLYKVLQKTNAKPTVLKLIPNWIYAAAASITLLFVSYYFFNSATSISSDFGEQLTYVLPDGSEVKLNAKSSIEYHKKNWNKERTLYLKGEAFFKVQKGATFSVKSENGSVQVLGTEFNVITDINYFDVQCYEGKVSVESSNSNKTILTQGKAFRFSNNEVENYTLSQNEPGWLVGESNFKSTPLLQVIKALEKQFNVSINSSKINFEQRFTGSFSHKNLKLALKTVFIPMEINYTFKNENTIILVKG